MVNATCLEVSVVSGPGNCGIQIYAGLELEVLVLGEHIDKIFLCQDLDRIREGLLFVLFCNLQEK